MGEENSVKEGQFRVVDKRARSESDSVSNSASPSSSEGVASADKLNEASQSGEDAAGGNEGARGQTQVPVDFPNFVLSLATQALVMLGEVPHPETQRVSVSLPAAKQTIDILSMLEEKTKGNLSKEELGLLTDVLANLQLIYVQKLSKS